MAPAPDARLERALEHCRAKEWAQAEAVCRQVLAERPQDGLAMQILGRIALAVGNPGSAVQLLSRAASLEPAQASHVQFLATAFFDLGRSEEHTSELQSLRHLVCRLLLEKKKTKKTKSQHNNS